MAAVNDVLKLEEAVQVRVNAPAPGASPLAGCIAHVDDATGEIVAIQMPGAAAPDMSGRKRKPTEYYAPTVRVRFEEVESDDGSRALTPFAIAGQRMEDIRAGADPARA